ncbi:hypothetical protein [Myxococcus virescens]|uniref:hypothetical protein n=1 Tax=Myxococcus virescens TaxID=83456 RepID=UPI0011BDF1DF|nr:hypothetical protein [Myxococcus virescens]
MASISISRTSSWSSEYSYMRAVPAKVLPSMKYSVLRFRFNPSNSPVLHHVLWVRKTRSSPVRRLNRR